MSGRDRAPLMAPGLASGRPRTVALVSDRTALDVVGVEWRVLRSHCERHGIPIGKLGRRPVVELHRVLESLGLSDAAPVSVEQWDEDAAVQRLARRSR